MLLQKRFVLIVLMMDLKVFLLIAFALASQISECLDKAEPMSRT